MNAVLQREDDFEWWQCICTEPFETKAAAEKHCLNLLARLAMGKECFATKQKVKGKQEYLIEPMQQTGRKDK